MNTEGAAKVPSVFRSYPAPCSWVPAFAGMTRGLAASYRATTTRGRVRIGSILMLRNQVIAPSDWS